MNVVRVLQMLLVLPINPSAAFADTVNSLRDLLLAYRCPLVARLERLYEQGEGSNNTKRFLMVSVPHRQGYVQCMFFDNRSKLRCDAWSGYYSTKPGEPRKFYLPPDAVAALSRLGFDTDDSRGNFRLELDLGRAAPNFNATADLILTALHDAYGARYDMNLGFVAPFAPPDTAKCNRVS